MTNRTSLTISLCLIALTSFSQPYRVRHIIIWPKNVRSFRVDDGANDPNIAQGIDLTIKDSVGNLMFITYIKDDLPDGDAFSFDPETNMPVSKEHYAKGKKNGISYYWNNKGELIRTEQWRNGKLTSVKNHKK